MLLRKIKIKGFKSFADEVELEIERGITAVVGPNGCGKSNIADSINWALGEQSPTSLRGKKMEQMIFNGSSSRKAMGMAEVTLTLKSHEDLEENLDFDDDEVEDLERDGQSLAELLQGVRNGEVSITRRMFRDSHSDYLLNGKSCRLKDIQDLLMALGIGTRAITIVEQDKIASVISAKPADRRVIIEDAAGITKFKVNRHLTTLKLEHARNNLDRIEDLLGEQETQVRSLRLQASRAKRYRALQEEIRNIEGRLIAVKHNELRRQHSEISGTIKELEERHNEASAGLNKAESAEADLRQSIDELSQQKSKAREAFYQKNLDIDRDTNRLKHLRDGIEDMYRRSEAAGKRCEDSRIALKERDATAEQLATEIAEMEKRVSGAAEQLSLLKEEADSADADLKTLSQQREEFNTSLTSLREQRAAETAQLEALQREQQRIAQSIANAKAIVEKTRASIGEWLDRTQHIEHRREDLEDRLEKSALALKRVADHQTAVRGEIESVDKRIETVKASRGNAEATISALKEMEERHEGIEETAKSILTDKELRATVKPIGIVADFIEIDPKHTRAAVAAYSRFLEAVVVPDEKCAEVGIEALRKRGAGRAGFVPLEGSKTAQEPLQKNDIRHHISARGEHGKAVLALFPLAVLAADNTEALQFSAKQPGVRAVTPEGTVAINGGLLRGGSEHIGAQIFSRRERMEELEKEVAGFAKELVKIDEQRDQLLTRRQELRDEEEKLRSDAEQMRLQQVELTAQAKAARAEHDRLSESADQTEKEIAGFLDQQQKNAGAISQAKESLAVIEKDIQTQVTDIARIEDELKEQSATAGAKRRREHELRTDVSAIEERLKAARERRQSLLRDVADIKRRIAEAEEELRAIEKNRLESLREIEQIETGMQDKIDSGQEMSNAVKKLDIELDDLTTKLRSEESAVKSHRSQVRQAQEELERFRMESREKLLALEHLQERAAETLKMNADELAALEADEEELNYDEAVEQVASLKEKLERMGPVNLLADEEYEKQKERFETLQSQQQDVIDSIESLHGVIDRIDKVSRKRFREAFDAISSNFHEIYRLLFGGGRAELILNEEEDLLTAGIEIMVQPPGKRNQSATLLSGGEKTLSAFALILAVMEFRPTPFCILDESDAALDESNIRRIASLIRERSDHTQFIVVTHNKTTMEIADRLYGVTMEEPGVSRLVSVQFN